MIQKKRNSTSRVGRDACFHTHASRGKGESGEEERGEKKKKRRVDAHVVLCMQQSSLPEIRDTPGLEKTKQNKMNDSGRSRDGNEWSR